MEWLWISAIVLLVAGLLIFLPLLGGRRTEARKPPVRNREPLTDDRASSQEDGDRHARERDEMLDGVRNLARDDPKKVASMVRHWMKE
ncbi:MAG TPA: hypothetical protein DEA96_08135 [Leptospiraceae bacterium]|nr:hypothetical protein [Spirochaetaceae bacterium]HBS04917.1 hypothetical protein [Leptospiraceae bacterium]